MEVEVEVEESDEDSTSCNEPDIRFESADERYVPLFLILNS